MATLRGYKCTKCGYVVMADFVTNYYFFCSHCNDIVKVPLQEQYPICQNVGEWMGFVHGIL